MPRSPYLSFELTGILTSYDDENRLQAQFGVLFTKRVSVPSQSIQRDTICIGCLYLDNYASAFGRGPNPVRSDKARSTLITTVLD